ncbi:hypothetical protein JCM8097_000945 [Rhodosporidiobolus ruineniae]
MASPTPAPLVSPLSAPVSEGAASGTATPSIPPYLLDYLLDFPLPVCAYSHADLASSTSLPPPFFQSPALESFLYQGAGGAALLRQQQLKFRGSKVDKDAEKAREKAIEAARAKAPKDLSSALVDNAKEPFRKWLVDGIHTAVASVSQASTEPSTPTVATASTTAPFIIPSSSATASSSVTPTSAVPTRPPAAPRAPSVASSRGTFNSFSSSLSGSGLSSSLSSTSQRQVGLKLLNEINFSKTWWRAQCLPELGFTILTQLPPSSIANGGQISLVQGEDAGGGSSVAGGQSLSGTTLGSGGGAGSARGGAGTSGGDGSVGARSASASFSNPVGTAADLALGASAVSPAPPQLGLAGVAEETPAQMSAEVDVADGTWKIRRTKKAGTETRENEEGDEEAVKERDEENEPEEDGQECGGQSNNSPGVELLGDAEVSVEGARDATSLEGLSFSHWHAPVGLFRVNTDLAIVQANTRWRATCGLAYGESNDAWPARVHPDDRERIIEHYRRIADELPLERDECTFRWLPEGDDDQWVVCTIEPCFIGGRLEGYHGMLENINKHKQAETAFEVRERELRNELAVLSETTTVGLVRIDLDGRFLSANNAWYDIVHVRKGDELDAWVQNMHPDDHDWVLAEWSEALKLRQPYTVRFRWKYGDVCLVQAVPNSSNPDEATGWIGSVTNVTAQAQAEEAVLNLSKEREARANREAQEAEERRKIAVEEKRQQELLIDVTSHEIRNPISAILQNSDFTRSSLQSLRRTLCELKERSALPAELDGKLLHDLDEDIEALDSITECGLAQERIANDILGLAQIQLSKYSITPVEFDLATSLRNICRMFKSECRSKGIELKLVIGSSLARLGPRARVFADPARLTQVLVNLLSNAIRFTAKSAIRKVTLSVEVSGMPPDRDSPLIPPHEVEKYIDRQKPVYLFFSVEDTGPGMTEEETGRLFAKFMQASPFTHTTWGGSGLGLWIARNLCELQAGRIEVASTVGKGSIFRCFITARSVDAGLPHDHEQPVAVIEGITAPNASRGAAPTVYLAKPGQNSTPLQGLTILCCEDNQINRTVLKRQLTKEGCDEILLACDGQEGLDIFNSREAGSIDCILMDIEMPIMDGLAATRAIRTAEQQGQRPGHQRIVGLTGNARNAQKEAALEAGMDTVVTKPYKVPDLVEKIKNDQVPNELGPASTLIHSHPGAAATATFMAASPSPSPGTVGANEQVFQLEGGASVEVITSGSPTSSVSSAPRPSRGKGGDEATSPTSGGGRRPSTASVASTGSADSHVNPAYGPRLAELEAAKEAARSMHHHGEGMVLPPSHNPERSLEK